MTIAAGEKIFGSQYIDILRRDGRFFIRYDSGGSVSWEVEQELTEEEAAKAQGSDSAASEVLRSIEDRQATRVDDGKHYIPNKGIV